MSSSVDTCHAEMDNAHCPNKSSHTLGHLSMSARNLLGYLSMFVRMDPSDTFCHSHWPWNTSSHMDHANKFSRNHLTSIDRLIHCPFCHHQRPLTMNQRQSIKSTTCWFVMRKYVD